LALQVLRPLRGCLPGGRAGTHSGFRVSQLYTGRRHLGSPDARGRSQADSLQMLTQAIFFYIFAAMVLGGGLLTITRRNAVHSAISLIVSLMGVAGLYLLQ